jgi:hypothetical protein
LFNYLNAQQKEVIKSAIIEKGLCRGLLAYEGLLSSGPNANAAPDFWVKAEFNWNQVCNSSMGIGALAIADEEPKLAEYILREVIQDLPYAMVHFGPDGGWYEGPHYWAYATSYNIPFLDALETCLGTDFGLSKIDGFSKTVMFPLYLTGPSDIYFNYADGEDRPDRETQNVWLASKYTQPAVAQYHKQHVTNPDPLDLLWYRADLINDKSAPPPLAAYFRTTEVATMRGSWNDNNTWFIGFKAGDNKVGHGHLDLGSFVLDAYGKRFLMDLGQDNYNAPGYMSPARFTFYRTRAEGHNTFVINPDKRADQDSSAFTRIIKFDTKGTTSFAVADLTPAYAANAEKAVRGIALVNGNTVIIQDEIKTLKPSKFYWFAHTKAKVEIASDGKHAILTIDSVHVEAEIVSPAKARFSVMDAVPLSTSPMAANNKNEGIRKLYISLDDVTDERVIVMIQQVDGKSVGVSPFLKPVSKW